MSDKFGMTVIFKDKKGTPFFTAHNENIEPTQANLGKALAKSFADARIRHDGEFLEKLATVSVPSIEVETDAKNAQDVARLYEMA